MPVPLHGAVAHALWLSRTRCRRLHRRPLTMESLEDSEDHGVEQVIYESDAINGLISMLVALGHCAT
jgi:hypothetical protein